MLPQATISLMECSGINKNRQTGRAHRQSGGKLCGFMNQLRHNHLVPEIINNISFTLCYASQLSMSSANAQAGDNFFSLVE